MYTLLQKPRGSRERVNGPLGHIFGTLNFPKD